jgi:glycosyltransferase involved in cell wall biosynthesis
MKFCWAINGSRGKVKGRVYGYSTHRTELRKAVESLGFEVTSDIDGDSDIVVHVVGPNGFHPVPGKRNVLVTTVDSTEPTFWSADVHKAEALIVPCRYDFDVLSRHYRGPVHIVPEGIQPEFSFTERRTPGPDELFRFLFHGDWNNGRKGVDLVIGAWQKWFASGRMPANVQLVVKTYEAPFPQEPLIRIGAMWIEFREKRFPNRFPVPWLRSPFGWDFIPQEECFPETFWRETDWSEAEGLPEIIIDQRDLPLADLVQLYQSSHAFIFPTRSGGVTLTQALASGLPSAWTDWGAIKNYADAEMGIPLEPRRKVQVYDSQISGAALLCAEPGITDIIKAMERMYHENTETLRLARVASERMKPFTVENEARRFVQACKEVLARPAAIEVMEKASSGRTPKLLWATDRWKTGGAYGYSVHVKKLKDALLEAGVPIVTDPKEDFDIAVHIVPCLEDMNVVPLDDREFSEFLPIPGKFNLLFTQVEMTDVQFWPEKVDKEADLLVTASCHSKDALAKHYRGKIEVCPEGIDPKRFPFFQRTPPRVGEKFRFLWVNNTSDPKGIKILLSAWRMWGELGEHHGARPENAELYIKASGVPGGDVSEVPGPPGAIWDTRNLPVNALVGLYTSAHAFVQCSHGEAWGLSLSESMSTGLPCVWTHWGGVIDYADEEIGFPVTSFELVPFTNPSNREKICGWGARASEEAVIACMEGIYHDYPAALERGRLASVRMHEKFTWALAAQRFIEICEETMAGKCVAGAYGEQGRK